MQVDIHSENNCINQNLIELIFSSLYTESRTTKSNSTISCSSCDICKNCMVLKARFTCTVTSKIYYVKGELDRNSCNTMYIAECSKCKHQYIGSALNFKQQVMIYRSDIKTNKSWSNKFSSFTSTDQSKFSVTILIRISKLFCWSTNSNNNCIRNLCKRFFHKQLSCSSLGLKNDQKFPSNFPASNFESC